MDPSSGDQLPDRLDRSWDIFIVQTVFLVLALVCVVTRAYTKTFVVKANALDDYLIYGAMAGYLAYGIISLDGAANGATGKHFSLGYTLDQASRSLRAWYLCMVLYAPITLTIRASVCVLLLRLSNSRVHRWIIWANFAIIGAVSIGFFLILLFQCHPLSYYWEQVHGGEGHCRSKTIVKHSTTVHSVVSALSDWCLGLLPVALLWRVNINRRTKAIIAVLLSLGMIAGIVLIVRIPYITNLNPGFEFLYKSVDVGIWSVMEPALGIIAACVATFRPLFKGWGFGWTSARGAVGPGPTSPHIRLSHARRRSSGRFVRPREVIIGPPPPTARRGSDMHLRRGEEDDYDVESMGSGRNVGSISKMVEIEVFSESKDALDPRERETFYGDQSGGSRQYRADGTCSKRWPL